jgi:hypothetical protein
MQCFFRRAEHRNMSTAVLVALPASHRARAAFAKIAPALTTSKVKRTIYSILEADSPSLLSQIVAVAGRFGFSYRVLHSGIPTPRWPLMIIFPHERGERRIAPRHEVLKSGQIILLDRKASVIECTVRNFSSSGAAVWLPNAAGLPPKFDLFFDNALRRCVVVWRHAGLVGVKFRGDHT